MAALPLPSQAQAGKVVRLVVPFTPGGSSDILARAMGTHLAYSSGGIGSAAHMAFELLKMRTGVFMLHIPSGARPRRSPT